MEFNQAVMTARGRQLIVKLLSGQRTQFTRIVASSTVYQPGDLGTLTEIANVQQSTSPQTLVINSDTLQVTGIFDNQTNQTGYYINTIGLYALDPTLGEILYSVATATENGNAYMPVKSQNVTATQIKIYAQVGNSANVTINVDNATNVTQTDIQRLSTHKTAYAWNATGTDRFLTTKPNRNLFNLANATYGQFVNWNGNGAANHVGRFISDFIPVTAGQEYYLSSTFSYTFGVFLYTSSTGNALMRLDNANKASNSWVQTSPTAGAIGNGGFIIPPGYSFMRISVITNATNETITQQLALQRGMLLELSANRSVYTPYVANAIDAIPRFRGTSNIVSSNPQDYAWEPNGDYLLALNERLTQAIIALGGNI